MNIFTVESCDNLEEMPTENIVISVEVQPEEPLEETFGVEEPAEEQVNEEPVAEEPIAIGN